MADQLPDFNVWDALGILDPRSDISFGLLRAAYRRSMAATHPDRVAAGRIPLDRFPTDQHVNIAYNFLANDQARLPRAANIAAAWRVQGRLNYTRTFFPELGLGVASEQVFITTTGSK